MSDRFSDNLDLVAPEDYVPNTVQTLLAHLHLQDAPRVRQEAAIADWLKTNKPSQAMVYTLRSKGFGHLVDRLATA